MKKTLLVIWEVLKVVLISLLIIIPIRYYLIQPFYVRGASMEPGFDDGEYLIIDELSYRLGEATRGDVIVFKYPRDPSQYYIKRIIGLPDETIMIRDKKVIIYNDQYPDGVVLDESAYLDENTETYGDLEIILKSNELFVMGDNRQASSDSRRWGTLPKDLIIGRVWLRAWPVAKAAVF